MSLVPRCSICDSAIDAYGRDGTTCPNGCDIDKEKNMRLLVFCGTRKAIERFDAAPDWLIIVNLFPMEQSQQTVEAFRGTPNAKMAVDRSMIRGWRAPNDTVVLFDRSWPYAPDSAESIQAAARVGEGVGRTIEGTIK